MFPFRSFTFRSMIHFSLKFVHGETYGSKFIFLHMDIWMVQYHLFKRLFFNWIAFASVIHTCGLIFLDSIVLIFLYIFIAISGFLDSCSFKKVLKLVYSNFFSKLLKLLEIWLELCWTYKSFWEEWHQEVAGFSNL